MCIFPVKYVALKNISGANDGTPTSKHYSSIMAFRRHMFFSLKGMLLSSWRLDNAPPVPDSQTVLNSPGELWWLCCTSITNCTKTTRNQILFQAAVACSW